MRFLADMGVAIRVVEWLRDEGYDARHLREEELQRLPS
jgi:predicted nuclease of predicted toxin-antitoxin system